MNGLPTGLRIGALLRRVNDAGGMAMVLSRGDPDAGSILIVIADRGVAGPILERGIGADGRTRLIAVGPESTDSAERAAWFARRLRNDPDLWIIELDIADAERFAAETILDD